MLFLNLRPYLSSNPLFQVLITTFYSSFNTCGFSRYGSAMGRKYLTNLTTIRFSRNYLVKHSMNLARSLIVLCMLYNVCQAQLPRALRCGSAATCLLGLQIRFPSGACISVSYECCVLSGRGLCIWLIQGSPTKCGVSGWDLEASIIRRTWPSRGCCTLKKYKSIS
jgi:hypothetical protein